MKTSLVMRDWSGRLARAAMPGEAPSDWHSNLHYSPAHTAMISHGFVEPKPEHQKESVWIRSNVFHAKAGKFDRIRKLPAEAIAALEAFDAERERLQALITEVNKKERALLDEVFSGCPQLKMTEVRGFKNV